MSSSSQEWVLLPVAVPLDVDLERLGGGAGAPGHTGAVDTPGFGRGQHWLDSIVTMVGGNLMAAFLHSLLPLQSHLVTEQSHTGTGSQQKII